MSDRSDTNHNGAQNPAAQGSGTLSSGAQKPGAQNSELLAVPNPEPGRNYEVRCETPEFTCVCPMTGQPDFATVSITYVPDQWIVELKSLKLYLWQFRQVGTFHEAVTNRILDDFLRVIQPRRATVRTDWLIRGGIHTVVEAAHPEAVRPDTATAVSPAAY